MVKSPRTKKKQSKLITPTKQKAQSSLRRSSRNMEISKASSLVEIPSTPKNDVSEPKDTVMEDAYHDEIKDKVDADMEKRKEIDSFMEDINTLNVSEKISTLNDHQLDMMKHKELRDLASVWCDYSGDDPGMIAGSKSDLELAFGVLKKKLSVESQAARWNKKVKEMDEIDQQRMLRLDFSKVVSINDLKELSKQDLITYLYFNSAGTCISDHKQLFHTSHEYVSEQVIEALQFQREESKPPTIADSLFYIKSSTMEEDEFRSTEFLQQHARNWIKHKGKAYQGIDPADDCRDILLNILDDGRDEIKESTPPPFKVDDVIINVDAGIDDGKRDKDLRKISGKRDNDESMDEEKNISIKTISHVPDNSIVNDKVKDDQDVVNITSDKDILRDSTILSITEKLTDFQIQKYSQSEASTIYRKHLLTSEIKHFAKSIHLMEKTQLLDAITLVRDTMLKRNRQMDYILEQKGQESLELLNDTPDITSTLEDKFIDNMPSTMLAKVYYKFNKKQGKNQRISSYFVWDDVTLRKSIKKQRDLLKATNRKESILKSSGNPNTPKKNKVIKQSTLQGKLYNSMRYSFTFQLDEGISGTAAMRETLIQIFKHMQSIAEGVTIFPWATTDHENPIIDETDFPETISQIQKYFKDIRPNATGPTWTKIRLGLPIASDRQTFMVDFTAWGSNQKIRLYECPVQHPNFRTCGWLAYMPRTVNPKAWSKEVQRLYEKAYSQTPGATILVGLSWRALNGQKEIDRGKKAYAMHVESPVGQAPQVKRFLRILQRKKVWPLGVRFRIFSEYHQYMKEINQRRYRYLLDRHKTLLKQLKETTTSTILELDKKIKNTTVTLREIVVQIRDKSDERRVFASIDERYQSNSDFVATFRPDKTSMAKDFIESLPTYVKYIYPNADIYGIFTIDAVESAEFEEYNPVTQQFTTQEDKDLRETVEFDKDDDSFEFLNDTMDPDIAAQLNLEFDTNEMIKEDTKIKGGSRLFDFTGEQDTVTTGASLANTSQVSFSGESRHTYDRGACSSSITSVSTPSKDTQITELEALLKQTEDALKKAKNDTATLSTNVTSESTNVAASK